MPDAITSLVVNGTTIEAIDKGQGRPILFLHPGIGIDPGAPVLNELAKGGRVIAPSHPGFGTSQWPKGMTTVDDVSSFYLDLLEELDLRDVLVVGVGLGGWIAAEIAVKDSSRLSRLVMANPIGVKIGDRETRDIADIYAMTDKQLAELVYADPAKMIPNTKALPESELMLMARSRESTGRYAWTPYMHNPKLKQRLHRIRIPALVLWGDADRVVTPDYGRAFAAAIPGAHFATIEGAGHFPHLEQPDAFANRIIAFLQEASR